MSLIVADRMSSFDYCCQYELYYAHNGGVQVMAIYTVILNTTQVCDWKMR